MASNFTKIKTGMNLDSTTAASTVSANGDIAYNTSGNKIQFYNGSVDSIVGEATSATLTNKTIAGGSNTLSGIAASSLVGTDIATVGTITSGTWAGTTIAVNHGGTGVTSVTTTPTATAFAGWDANSNLSANNNIEGYRTTATAAATTTLVVGDAFQQYFTGSTTQTCKLPVTSTLVLGQQYQIVNLSSGVVTVQSSGANTLQAMATNTQLIVTVISTSGTGTASWNWVYDAAQGALPGTGTITALTGDVTASGTGSVAATIASGAVTLAKMANLAANSIIGNNTGSPATPIALTVAQTLTLLGIFAPVTARVYDSTGTLAVASGLGSPVTIKCATTDYDASSLYSASTGLFTVASAGKYLLIAMAGSSNWHGATSLINFTWIKNGTTFASAGTLQNQVQVANARLSFILTDVLNLAANDTIGFQIAQNSGSSVTLDEEANFCIARVG